MTDVNPAPVHPRLVVIADEGRTDGLDLIAPETGAWLHALAVSNGVLVTDNIVASSDHDPVVTFGHRLAADPRLRTSFLPVGNGVAVSVKRAS